MRKRGYLIRFIDVGLIFLFGFLMISDVRVVSQIGLPGNFDLAPGDETETDSVYLAVVIDSVGVFSIKDPASPESLYAGITTARELEFILKTLKEQQAGNSRRFSVLVEAAPEAPLQELIEVLDVCERLALPKHIRLETMLGKETSASLPSE